MRFTVTIHGVNTARKKGDWSHEPWVSFRVHCGNQTRQAAMNKFDLTWAFSLIKSSTIIQLLALVDGDPWLTGQISSQRCTQQCGQRFHVMTSTRAGKRRHVVCPLCCDISECVSGRFCQFAFANALPGGTKSIPEQMLTFRKSCGNVTWKYWRYDPLWCLSLI